VLAADATDLRPSIAAAQWNFHGTRYARTGSILGLYDTSISQAVNGDGTFAENLSSVQSTETLYDASVSQPASSHDKNAGVFGQALLGRARAVLSTQGGLVAKQVSDPFSIGSKQLMNILELRSPVRANDQYVQFQGTDIDIGDVDRDGTDDKVDILMYATVVGVEQVELPSLGRTVSAVRVDSTRLVRFTPSSTAKAMDVDSSIVSVWYASGIGIVRERGSAVSTTGTGPVEFDEVLFSWNGVNSGLGAVGPRAFDSVAQYLPPPLAATVMGNEAIVISGDGSVPAPSSITASVFSSNGQLLRVAGLEDLRLFGERIQLFGTGDSTALLVRSGLDASNSMQVNLQNLDDTPTTLGDSHTISPPAGTGYVASTWDGHALWVLWEQAFAIAGSQLMVQPFDTNGNALAPPQVLDQTSNGWIGAANAAGSNGSALFSWATGSAEETTFHYGVVSGSNAMARVLTLGVGGPGYAGSISAGDAPVPVLGSGVAALFWRGPLFSSSMFAPLPEENPRGVLLDSNFDLIRSTTGSLDDELLPATWAAPYEPMMVAALGDRLVSAGYASGQHVSYSLSIVDVLHTAILSPGTSPLATAASNAIAFEAAGGDWASLASEMPRQILLWPDRALVVGASPDGTTALTQVWLN
jgi:hypothetical protein